MIYAYQLGKCSILTNAKLYF